ncbi:MAG: hypothetical protein CSB24_03275 [Deltaproteobacteria bacterium]|nr:MAG: hypothetical protein CSB24_03275 [Deltaproteobacteria bacterium]
MKLICPHCSLEGKTRDSFYNRKVACPGCKKRFVLDCSVILGRHQKKIAELEKMLEEARSLGAGAERTEPESSPIAEEDVIAGLSFLDEEPAEAPAEETKPASSEDVDEVTRLADLAGELLGELEDDKQQPADPAELSKLADDFLGSLKEDEQDESSEDFDEIAGLSSLDDDLPGGQEDEPASGPAVSVGSDEIDELYDVVDEIEIIDEDDIAGEVSAAEVEVDEPVADEPDEADRDDEPVQEQQEYQPQAECSSCGCLVEADEEYRLGDGVYCSVCIPVSGVKRGGKKKKAGIFSSLLKKSSKGAAGESKEPARHDEPGELQAPPVKPGSGKTAPCSSCGNPTEVDTSYSLGGGIYCYDCIPFKADKKKYKKKKSSGIFSFLTGKKNNQDNKVKNTGRKRKVKPQAAREDSNGQLVSCSSCGSSVNSNAAYKLGSGIYCDNCNPTAS